MFKNRYLSNSAYIIFRTTPDDFNGAVVPPATITVTTERRAYEWNMPAATAANPNRVFIAEPFPVCVHIFTNTNRHKRTHKVSDYVHARRMRARQAQIYLFFC